ncbi:Stk1 family PASTA domain-containing Ser/Thr kinase [Bacillus shivajii]|uniref:Stk1 family PASTA domain-containing Ser/Thr kinase n=1 Tax=Bacillus shivajii TaxID=1983719 RepID=UPI001CF979CC|nr:Stk1 family PASTA domain-containing Ser/Thr kinase [Bacillus shivajii]UCZ51782.1 Stk1 family PASTA domain-containing Ser/Thr kinase [Bacillus shivajii]
MKGERINERYQIVKPVGGGGMADVYLAHDIILDREVAVKVLKAQFSKDDEFIRRFRREAQAATSLAHPNVVNIYDVGEEKDLYYIVMEYIDGLTLKDYIQQKGKLDVHEAVSYMEQMVSAIDHAHENRIIHRDLKPHNILISKDGQAKITDFGIARAISEATITHTNSVLGSVHYLSPEQARGGNVTYQSDIYSLGVVMYEMLTGEVPFQGDTAVSVAIKHLQTPLPYLRDMDPNIPQSVENVVLKATAKDPSDRFLSAGELLTDLHTVLSPERVNEKRYYIPTPNDEQTKAIPIIQNEQVGDQSKETLIHNQNTMVSSNDTEEKPAKKKKGPKFWFTAIILAFLFLFGTTYLAFSLIPSWLHVNDVIIPDDLIGMEADEAAEVLLELKLEVEEEHQYDDEMEEGKVISHRPGAGSTVKEGASVTLFISEGSEPQEMVDVTGLSLERAERELDGFEGIEIELKETMDGDDNTVLSQSPEVGNMIIPHDTVVTLVVSERRTYIMGHLLNFTRDEVGEEIGNEPLLNITYKEEYHPTVEEGRVVSQDPPRGTEIRERTDATIIFSRGPEPEPDPEPISGNVPVTVEINEDIDEDIDDEEEPQPVRVQITVIDLENSIPATVVDEETSDTTMYQVPMTIAPGEQALVYIYVNEQKYKDSPKVISYEELKEQQYE